MTPAWCGYGGTVPVSISSMSTFTKPSSAASIAAALSGNSRVAITWLACLQNRATEDAHEANQGVRGRQRVDERNRQRVDDARNRRREQQVRVERVLREHFERNRRRRGQDRLLSDLEHVDHRRSGGRARFVADDDRG